MPAWREPDARATRSRDVPGLPLLRRWRRRRGQQGLPDQRLVSGRAGRQCQLPAGVTRVHQHRDEQAAGVGVHEGHQDAIRGQGHHPVDEEVREPPGPKGVDVAGVIGQGVPGGPRQAQGDAGPERRPRGQQTRCRDCGPAHFFDPAGDQSDEQPDRLEPRRKDRRDQDRERQQDREQDHRVGPKGDRQPRRRDPPPPSPLGQLHQATSSVEAPGEEQAAQARPGQHAQDHDQRITQRQGRELEPFGRQERQEQTPGDHVGEREERDQRADRRGCGVCVHGGHADWRSRAISAPQARMSSRAGSRHRALEPVRRWPVHPFRGATGRGDRRRRDELGRPVRAAMGRRRPDRPRA